MAEKKKTGTKKKAAAKPKAEKKPVEKKEVKETKPVEKKVEKKEVKPKEKPVEKKEVKKEEKPKKKEKTYKISRSPEASKMAREKSRLEKKKGKFKRQNYGKKLRVPDRWRTPRGIDSGHRIDEKHKPAHPRSGYMTPQKVKGLDVTGYKPVRVFNVAGLEGLDSKTEAIIVAAAVGMKKRKEIQKAAQEKKIQILNFKE